MVGLKPRRPCSATGKNVAIIGSGPAGLASAAQLNQSGHQVTVYERDDRIGGLLMYGIPPMKLEKHMVDRRVNLLIEEGVTFVTNAHVGVNKDIREIMEGQNALLLACGATEPQGFTHSRTELQGYPFLPWSFC